MKKNLLAACLILLVAINSKSQTLSIENVYKSNPPQLRCH